MPILVLTTACFCFVFFFFFVCPSHTFFDGASALRFLHTCYVHDRALNYLTCFSILTVVICLERVRGGQKRKTIVSYSFARCSRHIEIDTKTTSYTDNEMTINWNERSNIVTYRQSYSQIVMDAETKILRNRIPSISKTITRNI